MIIKGKFTLNQDTMWQQWQNGFSTYLSLEKAASGNTQEAYSRDVAVFIRYIGEEHNGLEPTDIKPAHIEEFMSYVYNLGLSSRSQARILSGLKAFFRYLILEDVLSSNPCDLVEGPKLARKIPDTLSIEEVELIFSALDMSKPANVRNRAMLECLYGCGLRVSELTGLQVSHIYAEERIIRVIGKGDRERLVPIGSEALKHILIYMDTIRRFQEIDPDSRDILFLNRRGTKLTRVMVFMMIKDLVKTAGIKKNVSPHTFRHSFATHLIEGGASLRAVQQMLGHQSITTTEIYTHIDQSHLRDTMVMFHPRFGR